MTAPEATATPVASLWDNRAFLRLWFAHAVSGLGARVTDLALPLTAVLVLDATPAQMGALVFAGQLPDLLFGLLAGAWVDRRRRRPLLVGSDLGRAVLLSAVPLAAATDRLSFPLLWIVAFGSGLLHLVFTLASVALLPAIVKGEQLVEANSKLAISDSVLTLAGPSVAGVLVQVVSAPKAILADCLSFVVSAGALGRIGSAEPDALPRRQRPSLRAEIGEGLRALVETPLLAVLAVSMGIIVVAGAVQATVNILYLTRSLGLSPAEIGIVTAAGGVGSLVGAVLAGRLASGVGTGVAIIVGAGLGTVSILLVPIAGRTSLPLPVLLVGQGLFGVGYALFAINQISLRQRITPVHLMGRVTASRRFVIFCMAPLGAALGGWLGGRIGLAPTLVVAAVISAGGVLVMLFSPVRRVA